MRRSIGTHREINNCDRGACGEVFPMEREKIIFFRDLFLRLFVVGLVVALLLLGATLAFWNLAAGWMMHLFSVDEKALGRIVLIFFTNVRIVVLFFFLVPAIALHWMAKKR